MFSQFSGLSECRGWAARPRPPPAPRPTGFGEWIRRMQTVDPNRPLDQPMEMRSMDDEFNNLANDIDVCTDRFMQLQTNMTIALDRYQGCRMVGMDAHVLGRMVHVAIDIGLTSAQVEILRQCVPDLHMMENSMWEATQKIKPHLDDLLQPGTNEMVNHVHDNTDEILNLVITPELEACRLAQPHDEERGPVEPPMGECFIDTEFNYLAHEIEAVTGSFMNLQKTMTTALERYTKCLLFNNRIYNLEMVVLAAQHLGFDNHQMAYIERAILDLVYMEKVTWEQSLEIKPHLENIFEAMANQ